MMELCGMCSVTDGSGKASELFSSKHRRAGTYRLRFETGEYFVRCGMETPYPYIDVSISSTVVCAPVMLNVLFSSNSEKSTDGTKI